MMQESDNSRDLSEFSSIPTLDVPDFKSQIPDYLLTKADDQTRFLIQSMSVQTQTLLWLCNLGVEQNAQMRQLEGKCLVLEKSYTDLYTRLDTRVKDVEIWKDKITGFWPAAGAVMTVACSIIAVGIAIMEYNRN